MGTSRGKTRTGTRQKNIKQGRRKIASIDNLDYIVYIIETRQDQVMKICSLHFYSFIF